MRRYALRSLGREAAGLCSVCSSFYAAKPNRSERVSRLSAANDGAQRRSLALTQERAKIIVRALPGGRTAEASCRPRDRLAEHDPARRTWRRDKDEPEEPNASAQSHAGRKTTRPTSERSDIQGAWGAVPTSSLGHDRPRRQARASAVPLLAQCLSRPWEPPSCVRMALQAEHPRTRWRATPPRWEAAQGAAAPPHLQEPAGAAPPPVPPGAAPDASARPSLEQA